MVSSVRVREGRLRDTAGSTASWACFERRGLKRGGDIDGLECVVDRCEKTDSRPGDEREARRSSLGGKGGDADAAADLLRTLLIEGARCKETDIPGLYLPYCGMTI